MNKMKEESLILQFLKEFKSDFDRRFEQQEKRFNQQDKRFDQQDKRFDQQDQAIKDLKDYFEQRLDQQDKVIQEFKKSVDKRFQQQDQVIRDFKDDTKRNFDIINNRLERLENKQEKDSEMIKEIYYERDKVVAKVTWDFVWKAATLNAAILVLMILVFKAST